MVSIEAKQKTPATICKQESMRKNHVQPAFGDKEIDSFKITDLNDFLYDLYSKQGKSYAYTEGFLKFFYLLFGYAYTKVNETAKFYVVVGNFRVFDKNFTVDFCFSLCCKRKRKAKISSFDEEDGRQNDIENPSV